MADIVTKRKNIHRTDAAKNLLNFLKILELHIL